MDRRNFITRILPASILATLPLPRISMLAASAATSGKAWSYIGVPYPTDALPGIAGSPSTIPIMPTLPNGAHYTAHDWYSGNANSYDPCTISTPTPPSTVTAGEYVVDKFHPDATDTDSGDNAIGGTVYGTTIRPRATLPSIMPASAGTKVFVYGDATPRPTAYDNNRKVDYSEWHNTTWRFSGTAANPCWIIGIDDPRVECNEVAIESSTHLIVDGIVFDTTESYGSSFDLNASRYITFRNSAQYSINKNGLFDVNDSMFVVYYNNECAYSGYPFATYDYRDKHGVRPLYGSRYVWFIDSHIHHLSGDAMQAGNSNNSHPQDQSSHYTYFAGNHCHLCGENAVDNKNSYHVVVSQCDFHDFQPEYNPDGGTAVLVSNNDEGPWTGYHWILCCTIHDCSNGIRDSSDQEGEVNYIIGNILYDMDNAALLEQDSNRENQEKVYWVNNTIYNCKYGYLRARQQSTYTSYMEGNLFDQLTGCVFVSGGGTGIVLNAPDSQMNVTSNVMYGNASDTPTSGWASWSDNIIGDASSENPLLIDPARLDFAPAEGSPAINAMKAESVAYQHYQSMYGIDIRYDYLGNYRGTTNLSIGAVADAKAVVTSPPPNPPVLIIE
jgi:hypothetical protein